MATAAQILANQANAQHSTGPRTPEGKSRAARNNLQHGLTLGVLALDDNEKEAYAALAAELRQQVCPGSALEEEALRQLTDGAWRLQKIQSIIDALFTEYNGDPLSNPEAAARANSLQRYRAAAEMLLYRAAQSLRELQTLRLFRLAHLTAAEAEQIPPMVNPATKIVLENESLGLEDRSIFYDCFGTAAFTDRFTPEGEQLLRQQAEEVRRFFNGDTSPTC